MTNPAADTQTIAVSIIPVTGAGMPRFLDTMRTNIAESRKEEGNLGFDAYTVEGGGSTVIVFERWASQAALENHFTLPHLKAVNAAVEEHTKEEPEQFWLSDAEGLPGWAEAPVEYPAESRNVLVHLTVKPGMRARFLEVFAKAMAPSRGAPGNLAFDLYAIEGKEEEFILYERWASVEAHEAHLVQPYNAALSGPLGDVLAAPIGPDNRWLLRAVVPH